jgi:serine protease Do
VQLGREDGNIVVTDVQPDSPAAKAGLAPHDRVMTVDEAKFDDVLALQRHLLHKKAGDVVKFDIERAGKPRNIEVRLAALPKLSASDQMLKKFGIQIQELTPELAQALGLSSVPGVLVSDVQRGSPAAQADLRRGMVITHVAGEEFESMDRLAEQLAGIKSGDVVRMAVFISERHGSFALQQTTSVVLKAR